MERDPGDILDRGSIAKLKHERIRNPENDKEWIAFEKELKILIKKYPNLFINDLFELLYSINSFIWEKESDMRQGKLDGILYEVGIRAIEIRKLNNFRISIKNLINKLTESGFIDIKHNHLSEGTK
jgi:hypothetical protein